MVSKIFFVLILFLSSNVCFAKKPLTVDNIKSDLEAQRLTDQTIFDKEDYVGIWGYSKYECQIFDNFSFFCFGDFYSCKILDKTNNKIFMKCLNSYNKDVKVVYALIELNYYKNITKNVADLSIGIRTNLNIDCFDTNDDFSICHSKCSKKFPYDILFSGERVFSSIDEYKNFK